MLKVTFITGEYPPMQGGIADHTAYLAHHLAPSDIESSILISRRWGERNEDARRRGGEEFTSPPRLLASSPHPLLLSSPPPVFASLPDWGWRCWPGVFQFLKTHQPDILHIQYQAAAFDLGGWVNWLPWFLKKRGLATRIVTTFHDLRVPYIFPKAGAFRWKSMLALARHSDAVVCTNREDLEQLSVASSQWSVNSNQSHTDASQFSISNLQSPISSAPLLPRSPAPLLTLIPLGSNVEPQPPPDFERAAWRKKYQVDQNTLLLAYFGFLNESKGGEELIEALALLRQEGIDARLLLIGGDVGHADPTNAAYAQRVQALIERHDLGQVVYRTGYTDLLQVSANLLAADAVVMPYRDGVSFRRTTLIAALRHGCPVVSTTPANPAFLPEIRPGENMLLAPPRDAAALAQTVARLVNEPELRPRLAAGAKQLGDLFEWNRIAGQTVELYRWLSRGREGER
ncbi:MAG: glycosyltransferase family 4 protein [Anaerolineae bacterium]|nr:glycosyltransferase family 4 protein [Anaerolineae bacterium]